MEVGRTSPCGRQVATSSYDRERALEEEQGAQVPEKATEALAASERKSQGQGNTAEW